MPLLAWLLLVATLSAHAQERYFGPGQSRSGTTYISAELRAMQADEFANPGMLWVERGAKLWSTAPAEGKQACAGCHGDARQSMKGVSARHPAWNATAGRVLDVEGRINQCRTERQGQRALAFESDELLGLTAYVAAQSRGLPIKVDVSGPAAAHFERGRMLYTRRIGQMNLACFHCHEWNAGRTLLAEPISQGQPTAFPIYRLEWQKAGSLQRRLRACYSGVRAELPPYESSDLLDLSFYLAWRAEGLAIETPGVRR
jgi:sulfur-oxidizing protein SoxA